MLREWNLFFIRWLHQISKFSIDSSRLSIQSKETINHTSNAHSKMNEQIISRVRAAIYGMYIGDALSMPVHWYYDRLKIYQDFGKDGIKKYEKPMETFPGSIMNLSNTGGGGRGSDKGSIIGDVLVKGKKKYWGKGASFHYHHGMEAGDNTLDTLVARLIFFCFFAASLTVVGFGSKVRDSSYTRSQLLHSGL